MNLAEESILNHLILYDQKLTAVLSGKLGFFRMVRSGVLVWPMQANDCSVLRADATVARQGGSRRYGRAYLESGLVFWCARGKGPSPSPKWFVGLAKLIWAKR
jgi:hypothetical protein